MKIRRHLRSTTPAGIEVSGPGYEPKTAPGLKAGIALALDRAAKLTTPGTFYVREYGDIVARAEGDGKGAAILR